MAVVIDELTASGRRVEVVERKGVGHPDTICDAVADHFERALCRYYLDTFGQILHHNVDKALLIAGAATAAFGGGVVNSPIELVLGGRATSDFQGRSVPVEELAGQSVRKWFSEHMHALDPDRHIRLRCAVRGGSSELTGLFDRGTRPLANDTSIGVGYWPLSDLEAQVLAVESHVNKLAGSSHPEFGEDVKVLGVRVDDAVSFTVGTAMVDRYIPDLQGYREAKDLLTSSIRQVVDDADVVVNAGDDLERGEIFLTVTGTSAESGDDGEVGRGNRGNRLITPFRPMTLEAIAGKNPITHVGKLYNVVATRIAEELVDQVDAVLRAEVCLVSCIGTPIDEPPTVWLGIEAQEELAALTSALHDVVRPSLKKLPQIWEQLIEGPTAYW